MRRITQMASTEQNMLRLPRKTAKVDWFNSEDGFGIGTRPNGKNVLFTKGAITKGRSATDTTLFCNDHFSFVSFLSQPNIARDVKFIAFPEAALPSLVDDSTDDEEGSAISSPRTPVRSAADTPGAKHMYTPVRPTDRTPNRTPGQTPTRKPDVTKGIPFSLPEDDKKLPYKTRPV